ncbi:MAG: hypothetical protein GF416_03645 [Candidatus Altiarchaeales archaeon]|nr:hypothetical protein [Candidatus Altiarchaeales archaeon]MBD3416213.1 hypothetical protein [Candidatus Altiarchaeales archaeon]
MKLKDLEIYFVTFYLLLFSSLVVHEFGHIYAAQHISKRCIFTETSLTFDFLLLRRSGMTYFTCSHGVEYLENPLLTVDFNDITAPKLRFKAARSAGIAQVTSPLTTGWFTALMGPLLEVIYITLVIDWLSRSYERFRFVKGYYLFFIVIVFVSSRYDFLELIPVLGVVPFMSLYFLSFMLVALVHLTYNIEYYRRLFKG